MRNYKITIIIVLVFLCIAQAGVVYYFLFTQAGARLFLQAYLSKYSHEAQVNVARCAGSLAGGVILSDIEATGIRRLPEGTVARIQEARVSCPWLNPMNLRVKVVNGRVDIPRCGLVLFNGGYKNSQFDGSLYAESLYLPELLQYLKPGPLWPRVYAHTSMLDLRITGRRAKFHVKGNALFEKISFQNFSAVEVPCTLDVVIARQAKGSQVHGEFTVQRSVARVKRTKLAIQQANFIFTGDPAMPKLQAQGTSNIGDTKIFITLKGTPAHPVLQLSSIPPISEDELLVMLSTGSSWQGAQDALNQGKLSPGIVTDFVDYFLFGGSGQKLEESLGIKSVSLEMTQGTKGIEVKKGLTSTYSVIYGVQQSQLLNGPVRTTQSAGVERKLSDTLSVQTDAGFTPPAPQGGQKGLPVETKVGVKVKKEF